MKVAEQEFTKETIASFKVSQDPQDYKLRGKKEKHLQNLIEDAQANTKKGILRSPLRSLKYGQSIYFLYKNRKERKKDKIEAALRIQRDDSRQNDDTLKVDLTRVSPKGHFRAEVVIGNKTGKTNSIAHI